MRDRAMELFDLLNPIHHGDGRDQVSRYKTEPYVLAGDVYGEAAAGRSRRLDVVHRFGELALPHRFGRHLGFRCAAIS